MTSTIRIKAFHATEAGLDWLHDVPLGRLPEAIHTRLEEARAAALQDGYQKGYAVAASDLENRHQRALEERLAEVETGLEVRVAERLQHERARLEQHARQQEDMRKQEWAEREARELAERARSFDRLVADRERQIEERLRREILAESAAQAEQRLKALEDAYERGRRDGAQKPTGRSGTVPVETAPGTREVSPSGAPGFEAERLESIRRQAFQNGYDQGLQRGRLEVEARQDIRLQEARREGYHEGLRAWRGSARERVWALGVLHLQEGATPEAVRQRHRRLTRIFHPDHHPDLDDIHIKALNRARDLLES